VQAYWSQLSWTLHGLGYLVLAVAVAARAAAFPFSHLRNRLFCLAAFSFGHALYDWTSLAGDIFRGDLPAKIPYAMEAISFVPLWYFATGWSGPRAHALQRLLALIGMATIFTGLFVENPGYLQIVAHLGLSIPAGALAVHALLFDPVFRPKKDSREFVLKIAAYSLAVYTATHLVITRGDYFPASVLNWQSFMAVFGVSPFVLRSACAVVFMSAILALLGRFDEAMRAEAEKAQRETNKALRVSEAKLADILAHSPEGIIVSDGEGRIGMFNAGAEAIFGWRSQDVIGKNVEILMPERFRAGHRRHVTGFAGSPAPNRPREMRPEITGLRRNGEEFPLGASLSKISTPDGILITTFLRDISKHKAEQKELMDAKRQAEDASRAKSQFIANMSHELRTPLNAIIGFSEMLMSDAFAARRAEYAHLIRMSGGHLLNLINDILDLAKIEAGKFELRESPVDFAGLAGDALQMLAEKANTGGVKLVSEVPPHLPPVFADERALKQVLINLAGNALKFTPAGGTVSLFASLGAEGNFVFGVRDTGVGVSEEDQERLFKEFGQGTTDALTGEKGTGLGLKIAKGLALAHGGTIALKSKPGAGATFTVTLPASRVRAAAAA
jgi:PAS domain S-box-containing protein